jgi:hypothetical protein
MGNIKSLGLTKRKIKFNQAELTLEGPQECPAVCASVSNFVKTLNWQVYSNRILINLSTIASIFRVDISPIIFFFKMTETKAHSSYLTGYTKPSTQHHAWRTAENSAAHLIPYLISKAKSNPKLTRKTFFFPIHSFRCRCRLWHHHLLIFDLHAHWLYHCLRYI